MGEWHKTRWQKKYGSNMYKRRSQGNKGNIGKQFGVFVGERSHVRFGQIKRHLGNLVGFEKKKWGEGFD